MNAQVIDLAQARHRRQRPHSIEIDRAKLSTLASPSMRHHLATMLDCEEFEFTPQATLIERLRYQTTSDEFVSAMRITLEQ